MANNYDNEMILNQNEEVTEADASAVNTNGNVDINNILEDAIKAMRHLSDVLVPSAQVVMDTVADRIKKGLFDMDVTMFLDRNARQNIVSKAITALEQERSIKIGEYKAELRKVLEAQALAIDPDFEYPTTKKDEGYLDEDVVPIWFEYKTKRDAAEKTIAHFTKLPYTVCEAILVASGAIRGITYVDDDDTNSDMLLVYRQFRGTTPTLWAEIDTSSKTPLAEIAHYTSTLNADLSPSDRAQMLNLMKNDVPKFTVERHNPSILFVANGVVDARDIHYDPTVDMNVDANGQIARLYAYGTDKAEEIINTEYPLRYTSPLKFYPVNTLKMPVYHNDADGLDWNPLDGIKDLYDADYKIQYIFENLQATVRGSNYGRATLHVNKAGGAGGGNGKNCIIAIKSGLIGQQNVLPVSIATLGLDIFATETLPRYSAIMCGENEGSEDKKYKCDKFKLLCRQDEALFLNRKHRDGITVFWSGPTDWAMNEGKINTTDPSDSVYSAVEIIEYSKSFRGTHERRYIKDDYVRRTETLEYLLWYLVVKFPWREDCSYSPWVLERLAPAKAEFRAESRPAMTFMNEVYLPSVDSDTQETVPAGVTVKKMPVDALYEMYTGWALSKGMKALMNSNRFAMDVQSWCNDHFQEFAYDKGQSRMLAADMDGNTDDWAILEYSNRLGNFLSNATYANVNGSYSWDKKSLSKKRMRGWVVRR